MSDQVERRVAGPEGRASRDRGADAQFQCSQCRGRLQPRGLDDPIGVRPISGKGVGVTAAPIPVEHQASAQSFVSGMFEHECFELPADVGAGSGFTSVSVVNSTAATPRA